MAHFTTKIHSSKSAEQNRIQDSGNHSFYGKSHKTTEKTDILDVDQKGEGHEEDEKRVRLLQVDIPHLERHVQVTGAREQGAELKQIHHRSCYSAKHVATIHRQHLHEKQQAH